MDTLPRVLSGIVFIPLLIFFARQGGFWFLFLVNSIVVAACWEFYHLMETKGVNPSKKVGVAAALVLASITYWSGTSHLGFFLAAYVLVITVRELFRVELAFPIYDIATTVFGVLYAGWLTLHLLLLRELPRDLALAYEMGGHFVLYAFLMAWACDTGGYFVGMALGRRPLFPRVSPKKSVEGAIGGFLAAVGAAFLGRAWFMRDAAGEPVVSLAEAAILGVLVGVGSQLGDLVESLLKRDARIKDTSALIPGHGGVLDRFDSLLFSAPLTYYFLRFVVYR